MNNLRKLRENREIKQFEVAKYLGVSDAAYSQMESNIEKAKAPTLKKIALFFNVSIDYIIGLIDDPLPLIRENKKVKNENTVVLTQEDKDSLSRTRAIIDDILKK